MEQEHKHLFHKTGGSCGQNDCDTDYKCRCGEKFTIIENERLHFKMPKFIELKLNEPDEIEVNLPEDLTQ